ncbi:MAG: hypothetical protein J5802_11290 [Butyrivibrio sp.]|nr:hypothetical protein [Butyrivibrio sp.]
MGKKKASNDYGFEIKVENDVFPELEEKMVVLPHVFEGIDVNDERIETIGVREI